MAKIPQNLAFWVVTADPGELITGFTGDVTEKPCQVRTQGPLGSRPWHLADLLEG